MSIRIPPPAVPIPPSRVRPVLIPPPRVRPVPKPRAQHMRAHSTPPAITPPPHIPVPKPRAAKALTGSDLRGMNVVSLKQLAKSRGLKRYSKLWNDELINLLRPVPAPRASLVNQGEQATQRQNAIKGFIKSFDIPFNGIYPIIQLTSTRDGLSSLLGIRANSIKRA